MMISEQNTTLPTTPLSASLKPMMSKDGRWVDVPITRFREGNGQVERPADGSANLGEAVARARARLAAGLPWPETGTTGEPV